MSRQDKNPVWQGTLSLMVLRTLLTMGSLHGYGVSAIMTRFLTPADR